MLRALLCVPATVLTCGVVGGGVGSHTQSNLQIAPKPTDIIFWGAGYAGSGGRQWKKKRNAQEQEDPDSRAGRRGIVAAVSDGASPVQTILRALARVRRVVMVNEYR